MQFDVPVGDYYDNAAVIALARFRLKSGMVEEAVYMLNVLRRHIRESPDPKNLRLMPIIEATIEQAAAGLHTDAQLDRPGPPPVLANNPARRDGAIGDGRTSPPVSLFRRRGLSVHQIKSHVLDASGVVIALTWTYGLVVRDVMHVPGLEASPSAASVLAGSALAVALLVVRTRNG